MTASNRRLWTVAVFGSMAMSGAALQLRGAILPTLGRVYGAPEWQLGLVAPVGMVGYMLVIAAVGGLAGHVRPRRYVLLGVLGSGLGLVAMGLAPVFAVFLLGLLIQGSMEGVIRGLSRPLLSHFYPSARGRVFTYFDLTWAVGATLGPLAVVAALALGEWRLAFLGVAASAFLLAVLYWRLDAPTVGGAEQPIDRERFVQLLRRPEILAMAGALFFGTGVEGGLFTWLPYYATSELPEDVAGVTLTVMLAGYIPGRLAYGRLAERVGYVRLLLVLVALLIPAILFTFVLADGMVILAGVAAMGALLSGIYPMLVAYGTDAVPEFSGPVTGIAAASSSLGVGLVPAVMGLVISGSDAGSTMPLLALPLVVVLLIGGVALRFDGRADGPNGTADP